MKQFMRVRIKTQQTSLIDVMSWYGRAGHLRP
jgi:hypothetical protein